MTNAKHSKVLESMENLSLHIFSPMFHFPRDPKISLIFSSTNFIFMVRCMLFFLFCFTCCLSEPNCLISWYLIYSKAIWKILGKIKYFEFHKNCFRLGKKIVKYFTPIFPKYCHAFHFAQRFMLTPRISRIATWWD